MTCPHRPPCSACPRYGALEIAPDAQDALAALARRHDLPPVATVAGATDGFRLRARLAIRGRLGSPKIGLFQEDTHRVVHNPNCTVQHPLINHVASVVRRALVESRITCYSDGAHLGLARYLQVVIERQSQSAQVVLVANTSDADAMAECLNLIRDRLGSALHSLWFNPNTQPTNTILGPHFLHWHGPESVIEHFGGAAIHYPPGAFGQSNLDLAQALIGHVRERVPDGARVAEFYGGVGAIGLSMLERVSALHVNEVNPHSLRGLELGLAELDAAARAKVIIFPGTAGATLTTAAGAEVVIADPPRKGLDPALASHLCRAPPQRFIYVSCGLNAFIADAERLRSDGNLRLVGLTAFNLLPFTDHVETVAVFEHP